MPSHKKFLISFLITTAIFLFFSGEVSAAFSFEIKSVQPNSVSSKSQEVEVVLDIKGLPSESYFRVGWQKQEGDPYFGYIKNNSGEWVKVISLSGDCSNYFRVSQTGDSQVTLLTKIGDDADLISGSYLIKGHRFTSSCSATASTNTQTITVNLPDPTATPTLTPPPPTSEPTLTPTPTEVPATATPLPTNTATDTPATNSYENIFISEFMANPEGEDEWVELYNDNDSEVDLYDWAIDDELSGNRIFEIKSDNKISGKSYKRYHLGSNAFLNNTTDKVRLLDGGRAAKDEKSYTSTIKGKSWSKDSSGDWCQMVPTPNSANSDCPNSTSTLILSPTPTLNLTPTPTPKTTLTPSRSLNASVSGEVMGEEAASGENKGSSDNSQEEIKEIKKLYQPPEKKRSILFSVIAIGGGLALIFFSVFSYLKSKQ